MKGLCEQTDCSRVVDVGSGQVTDLYSANQPSVHVVTVGTESVYIRKEYTWINFHLSALLRVI